jgi:ATP-binding cassette subfamily B (MDR/TAP) protein 1
MFFVMACCEMDLCGAAYYLLDAAAVIAGRGYRPAALGAILNQDSSFFQVDGHSSGALLALLFTDAESIEILIGATLPIVGYHVMNIIACGVLTLVIYWKLGLVCSPVCLPLFVLAERFECEWITGRGHDARCSSWKEHGL